MKSYIKAIIIFNSSGERRMVPLKEGVNIITGESKTGKSALVEIMDYCLCSSRCTIPKGKITDFSYLYVMPMLIDQSTYIIARRSWKDGGKMYVVKESADFEVENLNMKYFKDKPELSVKDAQYKIESALSLHVTNMVESSEIRGKKASLRNMVSYLFQHQNLMASKFALFYRFADFYKRKDVIEQFPVFAGMIDQKYYTDLIELNNLKTQIKRKKKLQSDNNKSITYVKENLQPLLQDYYSLLNIPFDCQMSVQAMLNVASNLPEFDDSELFNDNAIMDRYHILNIKLEELRDNERDILLKINNLSDANETGMKFVDMLQELKSQTSESKSQVSEYICPLCENRCDDILQDDANILEATEWLDTELQITRKSTADFSEDVRKLKEICRQIESEIKDTWNQIKYIERKFINSKELVSKREKVNYTKAKITLYSELHNSGLFESIDEDIKDLELKIKELEERLKGFDVDFKKSKAQTFLSNNMNRLARTLDFEEEYRPINLNFGLVNETFDVYQLQGSNEKIFLYEMGSGANWVSCHIALFLSFLRYFATQDNSPMLLTMFFDQPSQVYFPQTTIERYSDKNKLSQSDLMAVNHMYKTIFDETNSILNETGRIAQIIIVDHVNGNDLEVQNEFLSYVRQDWRNGKALI